MAKLLRPAFFYRSPGGRLMIAHRDHIGEGPRNNCWDHSCEDDPNCGGWLGYGREIVLSGSVVDVNLIGTSEIAYTPSDCVELGEEVNTGNNPQIEGIASANGIYRCISNGCGVSGVHNYGDILSTLYQTVWIPYWSATPDPIEVGELICCNNVAQGQRPGGDTTSCLSFCDVSFTWHPVDPCANTVNGVPATWRASAALYYFITQPANNDHAISEWAVRLFAFADNVFTYDELNGVEDATSEYLYGTGCGLSGSIGFNRTSTGTDDGNNGQGITVITDPGFTITPGTISWDWTKAGSLWYPTCEFVP